MRETNPNERKAIRKATVVGAGAMGSGIAAQLANAGVDVYLLDIVPNEGDDRNLLAKKAIERMLKATPATDPLNAGFMVPENAKRITPGNLEDDLETAVKDADWIVEVVVESIGVKRDLFEKLDRLRRSDAIVSSNTSTIPLKDLVEGRSDGFKEHFVITHFFNPPRFMPLLEIVGGDRTKPDVLETMRIFGDVHLGKDVIICKDTPAFLANRIGIYYMFRAITEAIAQNRKIEDADAVLGRPMGFPKDGIFGLLDLVGIGIIPLVTKSLLNTLPDDDPFREFDHEKGLKLVNSLLEDGRWGRNSPKGGFYRMEKRDGKKQKQAVDLQTLDYYDVEKPKLKSLKASKKRGPRAIVEEEGELGRFAWVVVRDTLLYAAYLMPEIADDIADVDAALRGGYNAKWGPFQLIDQLGVQWFTDRLLEDGIELPPVLKMAGNRPFYREANGRLERLVFDFEKNEAAYQELSVKEGVLSLAAIKRNSKPLVSHYSASLWDLGDGVACLEFTSKMNTLDPSILWVLNQSLQWIPQNNYKALVIANEDRNFSLGANLGLVQAGFDLAHSAMIKNLSLSAPAEDSLRGLVQAMIVQGQSIFQAMRMAPFPVVGAPHGMAIGGGCEILLHCDALQASAETYMGLVESGVGLVPAWGGCVRYLERCQNDPGLNGGPIPPVRAAFETIMMPQFSVSTSAQDALKKRWLRPGDGITMNRDRVIADAKAKALTMAENYAPPEPVEFRLPGPHGHSALNMAIDDFYAKGDATWHDVIVADALATVLTGGDTHVSNVLSESEIAQLERENFLSLLHTEQTKKRIAHTLKTGKPLREDPLEEKKSTDELRAQRKPAKLPKQDITGQPLTGADELQLRAMADLTAVLLKASGN